MQKVIEGPKPSIQDMRKMLPLPRPLIDNQNMESIQDQFDEISDNTDGEDKIKMVKMVPQN